MTLREDIPADLKHGFLEMERPAENTDGGQDASCEKN